MNEFEERLQKLQEQVNMLERKIYKYPCFKHNCMRAGTIWIETNDGVKMHVCVDHAARLEGCWILGGRFGRKIRRIE